MILWFAGGAVAIVWTVLHDPRIDYRVLIAAALLPEVLFPVLAFHSLVVSVAALAGVMLLTRGRRDARRRWLAVPFGTFSHLVLDGVWTNATLFWWPFSGWSLAGERLPSLAHGGVVIVVEEVIGLLVLRWAYGRFCLADAARRRAFVETGALEPC